MGNYKELIVWQKSVDFVTDIYSCTKNFPKEELYSLTNQIRRSSISISSNIAEGHSRRSQIDYIQFFKNSKRKLCRIRNSINNFQKFKLSKSY
ncbi:four helix bundle protein [Chryseobacterium sp. Ch-15]|uniref:four helix bundle protein n=1 Tax=Chryseobacterium muglaense TaxID=2893752 RepID=UPI0020406249|nr:four helix bundle protein [Chryseobacterium muglaense]MCM2553038.1 four helix bundle protein [Chryseobacterium muglaense]